MSLDNLHKLFVEELKDLYSAENQLIKALPKMAKGATNEELKNAFTEHLEKTRGHVDRLVSIFDQLEVSPKGKKCAAMEGLIEEGSEMLDEKADADPSVLDAGLIGAAQRVEHYEIAAYGTVRTFARLLGYKEAEELLQKTLDEEAEADQTLTGLAEGVVNEEALRKDEESGESNGTKRTTRKKSAAR